MKKFHSLMMSALVAGLSITSMPVASAQETASQPAPANQSASENQATGMSPAEVEQAKKNEQPVIEFISADEYGFEAEVTNADITRNGDILALVDKNGNESLILSPLIFLKDGSSVNVDFTVEGNHISGSYSREVPKDQVLIMQTHGAAGCMANVLLSIAAVAGGVAGILSAPVTGPVGPLATVAASAGIAGAIGATAAECSGQ